MSQEPVSNPSPQPSILYRVIRTVVVTVLVLFALLFLLAGAGSGVIELIFTAAFGWVMFLKRTLPQISLNWSLIAMSAISIFGILGLTHWFLSWLTKARRTDFRWPFNWTVCVLVGVALIFLVGMSIGGIAHQAGWIAASDEPLFTSKGRRFFDYNNMRQLDLAFRIIEGDTSEDLNEIRRELWKSPSEYLPQSKSFPPIIQSYHLLVVINNKGQINGVIIFPRDAKVFGKSGGFYSIGEKQWEFFPAKNLNSLLQMYKGQLRAI